MTVTDAALPPAGDARNYTVIQTPGPPNGTFLLLASQVAAGGYPPTAGDYFHRGVPWDTRLNNDAPNGIPGGTGTSFNDQITQWCSACHTRYFTSDDGTNASGDAIYKYQHNTQSNRACTTCHVSHGSNAAMSRAQHEPLPVPGRQHPVAIKPPAQDRQSRHLPGMPRPHGHVPGEFFVRACAGATGPLAGLANPSRGDRGSHLGHHRRTT